MLEFKQNIRGNVALGVNPLGCKQEVLNEIDYVKNKGTFAGPKKVLIIGASSSYGLATRISLAFGAGADTIGVFFSKKDRRMNGISAQPAGTTISRSVRLPKKKA